jgi:hypothetical protein
MSLQPLTEHERQVYARFGNLPKRHTLLREQVKVSNLTIEFTQPNYHDLSFTITGTQIFRLCRSRDI